MPAKISLKYGKSAVEFQVPGGNLLGMLEPADLPGVPRDQEEIRRALAEPIESLPLKEMAKNKKNVVILVSDITRPVPSDKILPPIVGELNEAGVRDHQITVVFGLGYHRPHTEKEKEQLVGSEMFARLKCIDHDIRDCIPIGKTHRGTPVEVFRPVTESDFLIATGNIEFHYNAGYTGGCKALFPGVCSKKSIEMNHRRMLEPGSVTGRLRGNTIREDMEETGELADVKFILNLVLNSN